MAQETAAAQERTGLPRAEGPRRPSYPVRTERLVLRPLETDDAAAMHAYRSRDDVCAYVPFEPVSLEHIRERLATPRLTRSWVEDEGDVLSLAVELAATGEMIGDLVLFYLSSTHRQGEVGYVINPAHHGHGYATEAVAALLDLAFGPLDLHRVVARIDQRNEASAAVVRRLGLRHEATAVECQLQKGTWITLCDFAVLDREWQDRRRPTA